ncbi:hypothetical protein ACTHPH_21685 [Paenibacillus pasadenensis]|uniref:hypothetical protein n=1 Tax=Paenibacillus pasadenensis TaxID=217090 RepID=UPI00049188FF|nr:hypothetical protein [Paenibacillus pasadenensis]
MKIKSIQGPFEEVYPSLASVFESLPPIEDVRTAMLKGEMRDLVNWYEAAETAMMEDEHNSGWYDTCTMRIVHSETDPMMRKMRIWTATSERVVNIFMTGYGLVASIDFEEGSRQAAGYVIRGIKVKHPGTSASFTTLNDEKYYVTFHTTTVGDILESRRGIGPDENVMAETYNYPENYPEITPVTNEEYNASRTWGLSHSHYVDMFVDSLNE